MVTATGVVFVMQAVTQVQLFTIERITSELNEASAPLKKKTRITCDALCHVCCNTLLSRHSPEPEMRGLDDTA